MSRTRERAWLAGAIVVGLLARAPGILWGANFPFGWYGHHVDEYTHLVNAEMAINPTLPPRWPPHPYPKGLAAHVAGPLVVSEAIQGRLMQGLPSPQTIITTGRVVTVIYGTLSIFLVYLLARRLIGDRRIAVLSAWILALGGLHVSQSHYFVSDVPALFWSLLGTYWLLDALEQRDREWPLAGAGFAAGAAIGLKMSVSGLPSLALATLAGPHRLRRIAFTTAFTITGLAITTLGTYTIFDIARSLAREGAAPYEFSRAFSALVYLIQLPSLMGFPVLVASVVGLAMLGRRLWAAPRERAIPIWVAVVLPLAIHLAIVLFMLNNFLRHLVPFIPWMAMGAACAIIRLVDAATARRVPAWAVVAPLLVYQLVFVYDGERVFIQDPRNEAARWLQANVPVGTETWWQGHSWIKEYPHVVFPSKGRPPVLVVEMHRANEILSSMGWKYNYPRERKYVFGRPTQKVIDGLQNVFRGRSEYEEVARFTEGYLMPEYRIVEALLGNRSRNYVAEVVVFRRRPGSGEAARAADAPAATSPRDEQAGRGTERP